MYKYMLVCIKSNRNGLTIQGKPLKEARLGSNSLVSVREKETRVRSEARSEKGMRQRGGREHQPRNRSAS